MNPVKIGLLGLGTVGGGTYTVLARNAEEIARRAGRGIIVSHASVRNRGRVDALGLRDVRLSSEPRDVVDDPEVELVVELIGGYEPAFSLVMRAIENGKHVVTANKALIALHGNEIFTAAQRKGVIVAFEGAVAGGIPIIKSIREGLAGNQIRWLAGIVNGTGNYILTEMRDHQREFADVLAEAQRLGYAEADPSFDVDGIDAAHKLTILASIAFGIPLQFDQVYTEGISGVTREDVAYAQELGYRIKHLAIARLTDGRVELRVHPTLIPQRRLIANVDGVMNAVLVYADALGPTLYYGPGAGAEPTASAVVADIVDVVRTLTSDPDNRVPHLAFKPDQIADLPIMPIEEIESAYYLRLQAADRPGVMAQVSRIMGDLDISIEAIVQKEPGAGETTVPVIMLTRRVQEARINDAIRQFEALDAIIGDVTRIRVETLG
ncbi:MAG: homoserine dehydrogenase [Halofilum sp. (in: g-proteobacteria)]|nr:homoserine dehydrogenase [Halofilum sp. (in: g-proteobacteria)]